MSWWAIQAQAQSEEYVYRRLLGGDYNSFWPHTSDWVATGHKAQSRLLKRSWLTGYLFVEADRENLWAVTDLPGVASIVRGACTEPFPIPIAWIEDLMARCDSEGTVMKTEKLPRKNKFRTGDIVRITDESSPLQGLTVEITKALDNGSVRVISELFGKVSITNPEGEVIKQASHRPSVLRSKSSRKKSHADLIVDTAPRS